MTHTGESKAVGTGAALVFLSGKKNLKSEFKKRVKKRARPLAPAPHRFFCLDKILESQSTNRQ